MLNAPLPVVSMSWSRLVLLVLVLSFILSSLLSLFFLDDLDTVWSTSTPLQHSLHIAHSLLPPTSHAHQQHAAQQKAHAPHSPSHPPHSSTPPSQAPGSGHPAPSPSSPSPLPHGVVVDNETEAATDAALGVSLSRLLFSALEDDERSIDAMEQRVREAKAAQQRTKPPPTSPYATQPLALSNLTQHHHTAHLALLLRPTPDTAAGEDDAATTFSLIVVDPAEGGEGISGEERSRVDWYRRPAASFFLPTPPTLRLIITDDWQVSASSSFPGRVDLTATTVDHAWLALAVTSLQPPFDYALSLRIFHHHQRFVDIALPGHQPVTALTLLSHDATSAKLLVARHLDTRRFRAFRVVDGKEEEREMRVERDEDGPMVTNGVVGGAGDILRIVHYKESEDGEESVVLIEYDERHNRQSPFAAALYTLTRSTEAPQVNDSGTSAASVEVRAERAELLAVSDAITQDPLTPAEPPVSPEDVGAQPISVEQRLLHASAVASASSSLSFPPSSSSSSWQLTSTFPRYRSTGSLHPLPPSALISSSSPSHAYVAYSSTPFLTTVDRSHHFNPIEIIHLHPSTAFTHIAISEVGSLIALIDQQHDIILLQRPHAGHMGSIHGASEGKSQWEVALELILPSLLKRLPVLSASILTSRQQHSAQSVDSAPPAALSEQQRENEADTGGTQGPPPLPLMSDRLYLCLLFEGGVVATFALDVSEGLDAASLGYSLESTSMDKAERRPLHPLGMGATMGIDAVGEMLWLNWEFLIGLTHPPHTPLHTAHRTSCCGRWWPSLP